MKRSVIMFMISAVAFLLLANIQARAADIIVAKSCEQKDVQEAISAAVDGDTVVIPAGACTWVTCVTIPGKAITLKGAGTGQTVITGSDTDIAVLINSVEGKSFRITAIGFVLVRRDAIIVKGNCKAWRIDHCDFKRNGPDYYTAIKVSGYTYGVIDHCLFENVQAVVVAEALHGHDPWKRPLSLGSANAVYIEDCRIDSPLVGANNMDGNAGARYVVRHNAFVDSFFEVHGLQNTDMRGSFSYEIYNNTFTARGGSNWVAAFLRGGTGVLYNNSVVNERGDPYNNFCIVRDYRSVASNAWGPCDGTSVNDGNVDGTGYPCMDQIGRSTDAGQDSVHPQAYEPVYAWNNTFDGEAAEIVTDNNDSNGHVLEGRDFFNDTPKPGYKPYTYPHFLSVQGEIGRLLNLHKNLAGNQVTLNWEAISGAVGYGISRDWGAVSPVSGTTYTDNNPVQVYIVYAYDSGGKIIAMEGVNTDDQAPSAPTNLHDTAVTSYSVTLIWDASSDNFGVIGYRIYQDNNTTAVANISGVTTATVFNLHAATPYSFTVAAYDAGGNESAKSNSVPVTTSAGFTISGQVTLNGAGLVNVVMSGLPTLIFTKANGDYSATVDQGWSGTVRPTLSGYTFTPPSIDYSSGVTANQVDQNYTATASGGGGGSDSGGGGGGGGGCFMSVMWNPYCWRGLLGLAAAGLAWKERGLWTHLRRQRGQGKIEKAIRGERAANRGR